MKICSRILLAIAIVAALIFSACGEGETTEATDEIALQTPQSSPLPTASPSPTPAPTPLPTPAPTPRPSPPHWDVPWDVWRLYATVADANLHHGASADAPSTGIIPTGAFIHAAPYNDEWYLVEVLSNIEAQDPALAWRLHGGGGLIGWMSADLVQPFEAPAPWPLPEVVISDFGRQVAEEFLSQFHSLFVPIYRRMASDFWGDWPAPSGNAPHFIIEQQYENQDAQDERVKFFDHLGNEVDESAPFVRGGIAYRFDLFDLDGDGIPEIQIAMTTGQRWNSAVLFRFIDGQYVAVSNSLSSITNYPRDYHRFFHDSRGNLGAVILQDSWRHFQLLTFDSSEMFLSDALFEIRFLSEPEAFGLTEVLPLVDLKNEIIESIIYNGLVPR